MAAKTAVAKIEPKNAPAAIDPDDALFEQHAGAGLENTTARDLIIPRVTILQALSPQLNKTKSEYVKGAEVGQIMDVGSGRNYGDHITFLPVHFNRRYLEWHPRASGKGLARIHDDASILNECVEGPNGEMTLASGNTIMETAQFFGFVLTPEGGARRCFLPMQSTQLKKAKRLLSFANDFKLASGKIAPFFYSTYEMGTIPENNSRGDWIGWTIAQGKLLKTLPNAKFLLDEATAFYTSLISGEARADDKGIADEVQPPAGEKDL